MPATTITGTFDLRGQAAFVTPPNSIQPLPGKYLSSSLFTQVRQTFAAFWEFCRVQMPFLRRSRLNLNSKDRRVTGEWIEKLIVLVEYLDFREYAEGTEPLPFGNLTDSASPARRFPAIPALRMIGDPAKDAILAALAAKPRTRDFLENAADAFKSSPGAPTLQVGLIRPANRGRGSFKSSPGAPTLQEAIRQTVVRQGDPVKRANLFAALATLSGTEGNVMKPDGDMPAPAPKK